jgi:hypothetical protein
MKRHTKTEYLIKKWLLKTDAETDHRIMTDALAALEKSADTAAPEQSLSPLLTVIKSKPAKIAVAAVVIFAALSAVYFFGTQLDVSTVAWAEVAKKVQQIETFTYKLNIEIIGIDEDNVLKTENLLYFSDEHGVRIDTFEAGHEKMRMFIKPNQKRLVIVIPAEQRSTEMPLTDQYLAKFRTENDPRNLVSRFVSLKYKTLGREHIDGTELAVIEVNDPDIAAGMFEEGIGRLWVDPDTQLPVRMELKGRATAGRAKIKMTAEDFRWNAELRPEIFDPNIAADYTSKAIAQSLETNEAKAIEALRLFVEITGRYPSNLSLMSVLTQAGKALRQNSPELSKAERQVILLKISAICQFRDRLKKENKEFSYYADKVKPTDRQAVLLSWQISHDKYKVILSDWTVRTITAHELDELKAQLSQ